MNDDALRHLETLMARHGIAELLVEEGNLVIHLVSGTLQPAQMPAPAKPGLGPVLAPSFGHLLYGLPGDGAAHTFPRQVRAGDCIALLDACGLIRAIRAPSDGLLPAPLHPEGSLIGYGTRLF